MTITLMFDLGYGYVTLRMILEDATDMVVFQCAGCGHQFATAQHYQLGDTMARVVQEFGAVHTHP